MIQIVTGDGRPIFRQIIDGVRRALASGELTAGSRMPSVRGLAEELAVNSNTVAKAYTELIAEGLLEPQKGVGIFVSEPRQRLTRRERERRLNEAVQRFVSDVLPLGLDAEAILARLTPELDLLATRPEKTS